jgi:hypothetical protein
MGNGLCYPSHFVLTITILWFAPGDRAPVSAFDSAHEVRDVGIIAL